MHFSIKFFSAAATFALCLTCSCSQATAKDEDTNLIPNGDFRALPPMQYWRIDFPYEPAYKNNARYVFPLKEPGPAGLPSVTISLPPGVGGNEGGKIESALFPASPGSLYRVAVDCKTTDLLAKLHVEAWVEDPAPPSEPSKFRIPAKESSPALVMCYRAQIPSPPPKSNVWTTAEREFTLPAEVLVGGRKTKPLFLSVKAFVYVDSMKAGQASFANFRLVLVRE